MAIDIYTPMFLEGVIKELPDVPSFVKDRYFGTPEHFVTEKVFVDYEDEEGNVMAPFVIPRQDGVAIMREGYETFEISPANIAPKRTLTIDDTLKRRAGESLVSTMTPEQRERAMLVDDAAALDRTIARREEWMCVNTIMDNACTMEHIADDVEKPITLEARFYTGSTNPGKASISAKWDIGADEYTPGVWYTDVCKWLSGMRKNHRSADDLVVGANVAELILKDKWVQKMLDNRRIELGDVHPEWQQMGVNHLGKLNFGGHYLDIFVYEATYDERSIANKKMTYTTKSYMPENGVFLASPNSGKMKYGAVTQMEDDKHLHTRSGSRVSKINADVKHNTREMIVTARPIAVPTVKSPWRACKDVFTV